MSALGRQRQIDLLSSGPAWSTEKVPVQPELNCLKKNPNKASIPIKLTMVLLDFVLTFLLEHGNAQCFL
ncbi:rCG49773 [Rattus norvegicus]|uniref:RCG49773 n=1 Tax=Rattus norvegicus TaxID=10116 RepID=A6K4K7_RAT|nr:rCG49773 [Rattus norvegicus]